MLGTRRPDGTEPHQLQPGEYSRWHDAWWCCCPTGEDARGRLSAHDVVEHEDGTITVSPSILVSTTRDGQPVELYHGYLQAGVWTSC